MLVVTGASGLLGACVLRTAVESGWETVGVCHQHAVNDPAYRIATVDLTDDSATRKLFNDLKPDTIVHCATATNVDWCEDHPQEAQAINTRASGMLAEIASKLNARLLYVSTDAVFDGKKGSYAEEDQPAPLNVYGESKLAAERETLRLHPAAIVARVNIYGWNAQQKDSLAEWILHQVESGTVVPGFADVFFSPTLVNDLAPVLFAMLQRELTGLYHVTGPERISKFEFARRVAGTFGFDPGMVRPVRVQDVKLRAARPRDISLNTEKIRRALGQSLPDVDAGLRKFRDLRDSGYARQMKNLMSGEKRP